jgi:LysW-gamma-L-lysine carboxypeptidase
MGTFVTGEIDEQAATGLLQRMLEIPSPSGGEGELARYLAKTMTALGFAAHVDDTGNLVAAIDRGPGPHVMLLGHLDTVPDQIPVRSSAGRLYGRGASDAQGPLAAMICAAASATEFRGRISVIGAVEEEVPSARGAVAIRETYPRPDACIIGEPSGGSTVVIGYKGKLDLRYAAECPSAHTTSPEPKASELVADCWTALKDILGPMDHTAFARPAATLESFSGDTAQAEAKLGVRIPPGFDVDALLGELRERVPGGTLTVLGARSPYVADRRNPVIRALSAGIRRQSAKPTLVLKTATSDMNTLGEVWDMPMASYGPGDSKLDHTADENILLADYFFAIAVLSGALIELADVLPRPDREPAG